MRIQQAGSVPVVIVGRHLRRSLTSCCTKVPFLSAASDGSRQRNNHHRRPIHHCSEFSYHGLTRSQHDHTSLYFSTSTEQNDNGSNDMAKNSTTAASDTASASSSPVKISMDELLALASCQPTPLSLKAMYEYAPKNTNKTAAHDKNMYVDVARLRNSQFLHRELPIRISQRAIDLLTLPYGLNRTKEVQSVANTYLQYLQKLRDFPMPTNAESEREFTGLLKGFILDRHSIPMAIARGLQSLEDERRAPMDMRRLAEMEEALSRFFTARVGLRFLVEHHVLTGNEENSDALYRMQLEAEGGLELLDNEPLIAFPSDDDCCGCIQKDCDPVKEVKRTAARVTKLCRESYGIAPEIEVVDCTDTDVNVPFTYVPHHLRYMLAELLKNSCRATVRRCVFFMVIFIFITHTIEKLYFLTIVCLL